MKVKLNLVRLSFANLFEPKTIGSDATSKPTFSAAFPIAPANHPLFAGDDGKFKPTTWLGDGGIIETLGKAKWKEKWRADAAKGIGVYFDLKKKDRIAFRDAPLSKNGEIYAGFEDMWSLNASNTARPLILDNQIDPNTNKLARLGPMDGKPYNGCYVNAVIDVWCQDNDFGQRINAALKSVQFVKDGDAFGGGAPGTDADFEPIEAPTGEGADDLM